MKIITISGKAFHGKDTCANFLKEKFELANKKVLIIHYADYLKYLAKQYYGWDGIKNDQGRTLLQWLGTDKIRKRDPNFWVKVVANLIEVFSEDYDYFLIPDTRFKNEIEHLKGKYKDVMSLKINRKDYKSILTQEQLNHPSETALDKFKFDYEIVTEEGLDNLAKHIDQFIEKYNL